MSEMHIIQVPEATIRYDEKIPEENKTYINKFTGINAGVCYLNKPFNELVNEDNEKTVKRTASTLSRGHHSIADHTNITVVFENISKMLAILLNSLQAYCTSEKSGRYTVMASNSPIETELYKKWNKICYDELSDIEDTKKREKIAQENARYFLSIFTRSTTMTYTTTYRQWNYIVRWCDKLLNALNNEAINYFNVELINDVKWLRDTIINSGIYTEDIKDNKDRSFTFLDHYNTNNYIDFSAKDYFGMNYHTKYKASFVQIAQAQRHRTIKYFTDFDGSDITEFFIPEFIKYSKYKQVWLEDMKSVAHLIPQASLINILEMGDFDSFLLKCKERLCARAQIEICMQTHDTAWNYFHNYDTELENAAAMLFTLEREGFTITSSTIKTKCKLCGGCNEPCGMADQCFTRRY